MTSDKAREFFSAHYEGSLEPGLVQALEQRMRADAVLAADYAAFVATMEELGSLQDEVIEPPIYLSDRIATRLEQATAKSRNPKAAWVSWWRGLAFGAAATLAIGFAVVSVVNQAPTGNVATGGVASTGMSRDQLTFQMQSGKLTMSYQPSGSRTVVVSSGISGKEVQRFPLDGNRLETHLENNLADVALFDVQVLGEARVATVALPGLARSAEKTGSGDVKKLAAALAGFYRVPVLLEVAEAGKPLSWNFSQTDAREAATQAVSTEGYSVDQRPGGLIVIMG